MIGARQLLLIGLGIGGFSGCSERVRIELPVQGGAQAMILELEDAERSVLLAVDGGALTAPLELPAGHAGARVRISWFARSLAQLGLDPGPLSVSETGLSGCRLHPWLAVEATFDDHAIGPFASVPSTPLSIANCHPERACQAQPIPVIRSLALPPSSFGSQVRSLARLDARRAVLGLTSGELYVVEQSRVTLLRERDCILTGAAQDSNGMVWLADERGRLYRIDPRLEPIRLEQVESSTLSAQGGLRMLAASMAGAPFELFGLGATGQLFTDGGDGWRPIGMASSTAAIGLSDATLGWLGPGKLLFSGGGSAAQLYHQGRVDALQSLWPFGYELLGLALLDDGRALLAVTDPRHYHQESPGQLYEVTPDDRLQPLVDDLPGWIAGIASMQDSLLLVGEFGSLASWSEPAGLCPLPTLSPEKIRRLSCIDRGLCIAVGNISEVAGLFWLSFAQ